jgi:hypothetical protein
MAGNPEENSHQVVLNSQAVVVMMPLWVNGEEAEAAEIGGSPWG